MGAMASPLTGADGNVEFLAPRPRRRAREGPERSTACSAAALAEVEAGAEHGHRRVRAAPRAGPGRRAGRRHGRLAPRRGPHGAAARRRMPTSPAWASTAVDEADAGRRARRGRQPRGRRHDAPHGRPRVGGRRARSSASTSASSATSPTSSPTDLRRRARPLPGGRGHDRGADAPHRRGLERAGRAPTRAHRVQRGGAREDADGPHRAARRRGRRRVLHHLRGRRPHRGHADRVDRLRVLRPRPDRGADAPRAAAHARVAAHAVRPHAGARSRAPSCASSCRATGRRP